MGRDPTYEYLMDVKRCMLSLNHTTDHDGKSAPPEEEEDTRDESGPQSITRKGEPRITLGRLKACPKVVEDLNRHARRPKAWTPGVMEEVGFVRVWCVCKEVEVCAWDKRGDGVLPLSLTPRSHTLTTN